MNPLWIREICSIFRILPFGRTATTHLHEMPRLILLLSLFTLGRISLSGQEYAVSDEYYRIHVRTILRKHCHSCHNEADKKAGINFANYDFVNQLVRSGELWTKVLKEVEHETMPPNNKPRLSVAEKDTFINIVTRVLNTALSAPDPGLVVVRRLSNREYRYTIQDLLGIDFDSQGFFPADGSGGEGFDNQGRVLFVNPLVLERYYDAAEIILDSLAADPQQYRKVVPHRFDERGLAAFRSWLSRTFTGQDWGLTQATAAARESLFPLATLAYRRYPTQEEKNQLLRIFEQVYIDQRSRDDAFDLAMRESMKLMLISPSFIYKEEQDLPKARPYPIHDFELATRLSYFLWSSMPDLPLLESAFKGELHEEKVLRRHVRRMIQDPKSVRLAESFATQWLEVNKIGSSHEVDPEQFPEYSEVLEAAMVQEITHFFHYVLVESQNFLELIDSDYTFLNGTLAEHYGVGGVEGENFQRVRWETPERGGVLGMAAVLTTSSLPLRTSPVLRGKWVLEQLLGTPPPPPPPDVPELEAAKDEVHSELDLRALLEKHRASPSCHSCHQKMDPLGLGLENFDAIGRWRTHYDLTPIDATGVLANGEPFDGPAELRQKLLDRKEDFATNLSRRMLSFAIGRGVRFQDQPTIDHLSKYLLNNDFDTIGFIEEVALSFPFKYKKSNRTYSGEAL